jgi:hypothetical protein
VPKTLIFAIFRGKFHIPLNLFLSSKPTRPDILPSEFPRLLPDKRGLLWVGFTSEPPEISQLIIDELDIFLGRNYVITHHDNPVLSIEEVRNASQCDPRL